MVINAILWFPRTLSISSLMINGGFVEVVSTDKSPFTLSCFKSSRWGECCRVSEDFGEGIERIEFVAELEDSVFSWDESWSFFCGFTSTSISLGLFFFF